MATIVRTGGGGADLSVVTAGAADVLDGKVIVDANGNALNGTISSKSAATITPGTANQIIAAGQYLSGDQTILGDVDFVASNFLSTANVFGLQGSIPVIANTENGTISSAQTTTTITLLKKPVAFFALAYYSSSPYTAYSGAIVMPNGTFYKIYTNPNGESYNINNITWVNNVVTLTLATIAPRLRWFAWEVA